MNYAPSPSSYLSDFGYSAINGNNGWNGAGFAQNGLTTMGMVHNLATEYLAVQLVFFNDSASNLQISAASVASTANSLGDPVDSSGNPMPQVPVTFSNGGKDMDYPTQMATSWLTSRTGATSLPLPAQPYYGGFDPALFYSDWIPLISVPRSDKGPGKLLHIRVMSAAGQSMRTKLLNQSAGARPDPVTGVFSTHFYTGRTFDAWQTSTDMVTGAPTGFTNTHNNYSTPIWAVRYLTAHGVFNVFITGESVWQGYGSDSGTESFAVLGTCAAHTADNPVEMFCLAQGGQPSAAFTANAVNALGSGHMGLLICPGWDGNNDLPAAASWAVAKAQIDAEWPAIMGLAAATRARGSHLAIGTPIPNCSGGWQEAARLYQSKRVRSLGRRPDVTVVDMETMFGAMSPPPVFSNAMMTTAPSVLNSYKATAHSLDGIHPGQAGHTYTAATYTAIVRNIMAGATAPS